MGSFESSVDPRFRLLSGDEPIRRVTERQGWTCAIDNGAGMSGTGLLVGPDLVLTNYHVVKDLLAEPSRYNKAFCRFDFSADSFTEVINEGRRVALAHDWNVIACPYSERDLEGAETGFEPDRLDYAIVRLAESIGRQPLGKGHGEATGRPRNWLTLPPEPALPKDGSTIFVWQHPVDPKTLEVMPQRWSAGSVLRVLDVDRRLRHSAETFKGSSGAPCFDGSFQFVALHHAGDPRINAAGIGAWNQAIPARAIVQHLRANGHDAVIGATPPPPTMVAMPASAAVEARVRQLADDTIGRRVRAATMLMDRDAVEERIVWSVGRRPGMKEAERGIVHVIACRNVDSHRNLLDRMERLTLPTREASPDARRRRLAAFLGKGATSTGDSQWARESISWHGPDVPAEVAVEITKGKLADLIRSRGRWIVEVVVPMDKVKVSRERRFILAIAKACAEMASADRLQVFVVFFDPLAMRGADPTAAKRAELGGLWTLRNRPPGCGVCLSLDDVASIDLDEWSRALEATGGRCDGRLAGEVEAAFSTDLRLPMQDAEKRLAPVLARHFAAQA